MAKKYTLEELETIQGGYFTETYPSGQWKSFNKEKKDLFDKLGFNWVKPYPNKDEDEEQWNKDREVEYNKNPSHFTYNYVGVTSPFVCDKDHIQEDLIHVSELEFAHKEIQMLADTLMNERELYKSKVKDLEDIKNSISYVIRKFKEEIL